MPCRVRLVRCRRARCQGVVAEDRRLEPLSALREVPLRRVRPGRGRLPASHHTRQGVMRRVEVLEHLAHRGRGHGPVVVLLCGTQPGRQGGFILRGSDRRPQAVLDGRGLGVVREETALRVAVGGGHRCAPCCAEEARQGQADREVVRADHPGCAMPRAQTLSRRDHGRRGSLTSKVSSLCRDGWSVGVMSSSPPAVALRKPQASQPARKCSVAGLVVASM